MNILNFLYFLFNYYYSSLISISKFFYSLQLLFLFLFLNLEGPNEKLGIPLDMAGNCALSVTPNRDYSPGTWIDGSPWIECPKLHEKSSLFYYAEPMVEQHPEGKDFCIELRPPLIIENACPSEIFFRVCIHEFPPPDHLHQFNNYQPTKKKKIKKQKQNYFNSFLCAVLVFTRHVILLATK